MKTVKISGITLEVTTQGGYKEPQYGEPKEINEVLHEGIDIYDLLSESAIKQIKEEINA